MNKYIKYTLTLFCSSYLVSCASWYSINTTKNVFAYKTPKHIESSFDISGRFFIKHLNNSQYGNFSWIKSDSNEEINFITPLGQIVARITINNQNIILYVKNKTYSGSDLDIIMNNNLGFTLPLSYLHYWIQGVAVPNVTLDKENFAGFNQLGWSIDYLEWYDINHPKIINLSKDKLEIKILINMEN